MTRGNRPCRNGSSGTTLEILVALTLAGASALTFLALRPTRERSSWDRPEPGERTGEERDDEP